MAHENNTEPEQVTSGERVERLHGQARRARKAERVFDFLNNEVWPQVPADQLGVSISKAEREDILGYGSEGV